LKAMAEAKQKKRLLEDNVKNIPESQLCQGSSTVCEGNRIVNLKKIGDSLICSNLNCQSILSLKNIKHERRVYIRFF